MPKRKISEVSDGGSWLSHRLSVKFDHEVQTLSRALKVARGFEKQKMGRRGKQARSGEGSSDGKGKEDTLGRLGEENKILKVCVCVCVCLLSLKDRSGMQELIK